MLYVVSLIRYRLTMFTFSSIEEAEEAERLRKEEIERNFDKVGELRRLGGKVYDFDVDDGIDRS